MEEELVRWHDSVDSLPLAVCVCDPQGTILAANREAASWFRYPESAALAGTSLQQQLQVPQGAPLLRLLERLADSTDSISDTVNLIVPGHLCKGVGIAINLHLSSIYIGDVLYKQVVLQEHRADLSNPDGTPGSLSGTDLLDALQEPVFLWRLEDGVIQFWNKTAEEIYGYSSAQACGQHVHSLLARRPIDAIERSLHADNQWSGELIHSSSAGNTITVEARMTLIERDGQRFVLEADLNVTERRAAEQALRFHLQLNKSITDQAVDSIFVIGGKGEILFVNPETERVFGWSPADLVGRQLHVTLHHDHESGEIYAPEKCPLLDAQLHGEVVRALELTFFHKNGTPVSVSCSNSPLRFENHEIGAVLIVRDITAQKQIERALAESEERLRVAVNASRIGTWDLNLLSGAINLDDNCRVAFGVDASAQPMLTSWLRALHPDDRWLARERMEAALDPQGSGLFELEFRTLARVDRRLRHVQARGQAFFEETDGHRKPVRLIGTMQDITERKRGDDALRRANLDLQQFAYAAAHDLQEPLRNVVNLLQLYKRNSSAFPDKGELDLIDASIEDALRMHQMTKDLLSFTDVHRPLEGAIDPVDTAAVLADVLKHLSTMVEQSGAEIVHGDLPAVRIHSTHLLQLLQNLLSNALKYRKPGQTPRIEIFSRRRSADWMFSVRDNGIGFDPAYARRIFGVFKRLHSRHDYPGSGIGLAICARIVHMYGGQIWAEGSVGKGATFHFTLPVASDRS